MLSIKRLKVEYLQLQREPVPLAIAKPNENNILEWRFIIRGIDDYEGGYYQGKLIFPETYPHSPPTVMMCTPSGRFAINKRICLSISDFHPESWTPSWRIGTILTGIVSFFNCEEPTTGSVTSTVEERRSMAERSLEYNLNDRVYVKLFGPDPRPIFEEDEQKLIRIQNNHVAAIHGKKLASSAVDATKLAAENLRTVAESEPRQTSQATEQKMFRTSNSHVAATHGNKIPSSTPDATKLVDESWPILA